MMPLMSSFLEGANQYFGDRDEAEDKNYKRAFKLDRTESQKDADKKWKKSMEEYNTTLKRHGARAQALESVFDSVNRYYRNFPQYMLDSLGLMQQAFQTGIPQNKQMSRDDLVNFIKTNSLNILKTTQKLYRECTVKIYSLDRRRFEYGLFNRPGTRTSLNPKELYGLDTITSHIEKLISSSQSYQESVDSLKSIQQTSSDFPEIMNACTSMIELHEEDIRLINAELEFYYTLRAMEQYKLQQTTQTTSSTPKVSASRK